MQDHSLSGGLQSPLLLWVDSQPTQTHELLRSHPRGGQDLGAGPIAPEFALLVHGDQKKKSRPDLSPVLLFLKFPPANSLPDPQARCSQGQPTLVLPLLVSTHCLQTTAHRAGIIPQGRYHPMVQMRKRRLGNLQWLPGLHSW